jgi:protein-disulfide isomerase
MKTNHIVILLLSTTIGLQGTILYRDYTRSSQGKSQKRVIAAPKGTVLDISGAPTLGSEKARISLIEFSDYECPFCSKHSLGVGQQLDREYVATGKVRHVFINNPLAIHGSASMLAVAAICAGPQAYWQMHDAIFREKPRTRDDVVAVAMGLPDLNPPQFDRCFADPRGAEARIESDRQIAVALGLSATPSFAIGRLTGNSVSVDHLIVGTQQLSVFQNLIDESLKQ